ncbi:MAG: HGGxSTG domain-containing protein [Planctomycetota bacterium]
MVSEPRAKSNLMKGPRCGAKTRKGMPCRSPAMPNGRCRMHGGKSTGPRTPEGLERSRKANWKHGLYSAESRAIRREIREFLRDCRKTIEQAEERVEAGTNLGSKGNERE